MKHLLSLCLTLSIALAAPAAAEEGQPVVVELFTSQGCSSCPPADEALADLAKREDIIALSLPVDYWDYLGWKDTLALHGHTERQYAYAKAQGESMVYTPQMVINGAVALNGNKAAEVDKAIERVRSEVPLSGRVNLSRSSDELVVEVTNLPAGRYTVWLVPFSTKREVEIGRGENAGRKISYVNVPRSWLKLGEAENGSARYTHELPSDASEGADAFAVVVQHGGEAGNGPIVAAAKAAF